MKSILMVMKMLENTKKGFIQEIVLVVIITAIFMCIAVYQDITFHYHRLIVDFTILLPVLFFLAFFFVHVVRLSIVYRSYVWLNMFHLPIIGLLIATGTSMYNDPNLENIIFFAVMLGLFLLLMLIIKYHQKFKVYRVKIPPERYAVLRVVMTRKQRFTLIFPDEYIKYLETGDEKYLEGERNAGK